MTIYTTVCSTKGAQVARITDDGIEFFTGYDFMGGADWTEDSNKALLMGMDEAGQVAEDLTAGE